MPKQSNTQKKLEQQSGETSSKCNGQNRREEGKEGGAGTEIENQKPDQV